jgi:GntR family transcriptional regulator/MocR family aminotransferase
MTAIEILLAEGLLEAKVGSGTYVSMDASCITDNSQPNLELTLPLPRRVWKPNIDSCTPGQIDFSPCRPSLEGFPVQDWQRCLAHANSRVPAADYGDPQGDEKLRIVIAEYLRRSRGLTLSSDQILITNGTVEAIYLLSEMYLDRDCKVIVENPGYPLAQQALSLSGTKIIPCGVDENGLIIDDLPNDKDNYEFVYVTPSHQFPTGSRLSLGRRRALIDWAEQRKALIIEDDYDGEFRYDVPPLPALASMPNSCVVYCGTFSKTMFPGLRVGFVAASVKLIQQISNFRTILGYMPSSITQGGLAEFIERGHYERHIHRMRRLYARKRKTLSQALCDFMPTGTIRGLDSGLNVLVELGTSQSAIAISNKAKRAGVIVQPLQRYLINKDKKDNSIILGYAKPSIDEIIQGIKTLGKLH